MELHEVAAKLLDQGVANGQEVPRFMFHHVGGGGVYTHGFGQASVDVQQSWIDGLIDGHCTRDERQNLFTRKFAHMHTQFGQGILQTRRVYGAGRQRPGAAPGGCEGREQVRDRHATDRLGRVCGRPV